VVATLGTATTSDHLESLYRVVPEVIFCFDGDRAGKDAAWRALENALPILKDGRQAAFMFLPDGEDPDSLVHKEGQTKFEARLDDAVPLSEFIVNTLSKQVDTSTIDGRARLATLAQPLIEKLPKGIFRQMMNKRIEEVVQLAPGQLHRPPQKNKNRYTGSKKNSDPRYAFEWSSIRKAIALLILNPGFAQHIEELDSLQNIGIPGVDVLLHLLENLREDPQLSTAALTLRIEERWKDKPENKYLSKLVAMAEMELPVTGENSLQEFLDAIKKLQAQHLEQRAEHFEQKDRADGLTEDELNEYNQLLMRK
jgi:DNA primase